jgi:hypothetical protein
MQHEIVLHVIENHEHVTNTPYVITSWNLATRDKKILLYVCYGKWFHIDHMLDIVILQSLLFMHCDFEIQFIALSKTYNLANYSCTITINNSELKKLRFCGIDIWIQTSLNLYHANIFTNIKH